MPMSKAQDKKRTDKKNKPKLTPKEKKLKKAAKKLRQTMFSNLYLVPHLLGSPIAELDIWHGSSDSEASYVEHIHEPYLQLWTEEERGWASRLYQSPGFQSVRERYIEIARALDTTRPGPERNRLVEEMHKLER